MDLEFVFKPEKLIKIRQQIAQEHQKNEEIPVAEFTEEVEQLILRLSKTPLELQKAAALAMKDREVIILAGYLPYNYYELDEKNLFEIFRYRVNRKSCGVLFQQWQEAFANPDCNEFLKSLAVSSRSFQELLRDIHIKQEVFEKMLESQNIPLYYDEHIAGKNFKDGAEFNKNLAYYGIVENSLLDIECKRALLTFCSKADYLDCSEDNLLYIIRNYDLYMLKKFLLNFISKMTLWELQIYPELAEYLRSVIGHKRSRTFLSFFEGVDMDLIEKYLDWINLYKINSYFQNDERSRFWKQYRFENVIRYPVSEIVVMEFAEYIAVEFLGTGKGTIYICTKAVFEQHFYPYLDTMDNQDLKAYFKENKDLCIAGKNHSIRWQASLGNFLAKHQIAEKINS